MNRSVSKRLNWTRLEIRRLKMNTNSVTGVFWLAGDGDLWPSPAGTIHRMDPGRRRQLIHLVRPRMTHLRPGAPPAVNLCSGRPPPMVDRPGEMMHEQASAYFGRTSSYGRGSPGGIVGEWVWVGRCVDSRFSWEKER